MNFQSETMKPSHDENCLITGCSSAAIKETPYTLVLLPFKYTKTDIDLNNN
jgi:hypothetical protein